MRAVLLVSFGLTFLLNPFMPGDLVDDNCLDLSYF